MTAKHEEIVGRIAKLKSEIKELWADCAILRAEKVRLRKALAFYANPENWRFSHDKDGNLLWITSLGPGYAMEVLRDVAQESSEEEEKEGKA